MLLKVRVKEVDCPAASVRGRVKPLNENPGPLIVACEIVTLPVLAVNVTVCEELLPAVVVPKFS